VKKPFKTNEGARGMIFFGVSVSILAVLTWIDESLQHMVNDKILCCIFLGEAGIATALGLIAYRIIPKRFILPIGIIGWLIFFLILFCIVK
jgi:quinol-cytochrome oxidoreductase complex cytochrome b subunit